MSTLKVDTIRDNGSGFNDVVTFANSGGTENARLCRAFVNFDGTGAVAIRANFNVNSITDNGTGDYTVNFANAMSDANYCIIGSVSLPGVNAGYVSFPVSSSGNQAAASNRFMTPKENGVSTDMSFVNVAVFR